MDQSSKRRRAPEPNAIVARPQTRAETRLLRLHSPQTVQLGLGLVDEMKIDRPHMAAKLSKLLSYEPNDSSRRKWHESVENEMTHIWALKLTTGEFVGVLWFERNFKKTEIVGGIDVLWVSPHHRKGGFGSHLVQSVILRYPEISTWTAFASQAQKDFGLHGFWRKNGFTEIAEDVGKTTLDGFFVRTAETGEKCRLSKRRILAPAVPEVQPPRDGRWTSASLEISEKINRLVVDLRSTAIAGVLGDERNCAGGCLCPPGEEKIWENSIKGVLESFRPKKSFIAEFRWWLGLLTNKPEIFDRGNRLVAGVEFRGRPESEVELQVLAGYRIEFWPESWGDAPLEKANVHGVVTAKGSKFKMVLVGGLAAKIRDTDE